MHGPRSTGGFRGRFFPPQSHEARDAGSLCPFPAGGAEGTYRGKRFGSHLPDPR